ncbi:MAG: hypothetical protein QM831_02875 [Kofleriaceae bacterium]
MRVLALVVLIGCARSEPPRVTITATVGSTRVTTREQMIAAGEMQLSGEPLAEAMGRRLANYSRFRVPGDVYFDPQLAMSWIDLAGYASAIESYEYSKQPMNNLMFESGAGTALAYGPLIGSEDKLAAMVQHFAQGAHTLGRFVFPDRGWPGMAPTNHVFASFDPAIDPTSDMKLKCAITSDDNPGAQPGVTVTSSDYECDASSLHLKHREVGDITPGADGFTTWKYGLWVLNYLQSMHDLLERPVHEVGDADLASVGAVDNKIRGKTKTGVFTPAGTYLGSSDIEGFQAQMFIASVDNRAEDWLHHLATADGKTLAGIADPKAYAYDSPLAWFPRVHVTETANVPAYAYAGEAEALDVVGLAMGYAEFYTLVDPSNVHVGASAPVRAMFDGDPFDPAPFRDRCLGIMRVAMIDLDRMYTNHGVVVDQVGGHTLSTTTLAYTLIGLRTVLRSIGGQLELYSNNQPDTAISHTPLDTLPIHLGTSSFSDRLEQILRAQADVLYTQLTDDNGHAFTSYDVTSGPVRIESLDASAAAVRGLFAAYLATGDTKYRARAIAVFDRMDATFYDPEARLYMPPGKSVEYTPFRFALVQSSLRDMYELVARRPGGEARTPVLEDRIARLDKLVLNGWDDRNRNRIVDADECVQGSIPRGGLQAAERTLTGEVGGAVDRDHDCVPEIDDAHLPAGLVDSITFTVHR